MLTDLVATMIWLGILHISCAVLNLTRSLGWPCYAAKLFPRLGQSSPLLVLSSDIFIIFSLFLLRRHFFHAPLPFCFACFHFFEKDSWRICIGTKQKRNEWRKWKRKSRKESKNVWGPQSPWLFPMVEGRILRLRTKLNNSLRCSIYTRKFSIRTNYQVLRTNTFPFKLQIFMWPLKLIIDVSYINSNMPSSWSSQGLCMSLLLASILRSF